MTAFELYTKLGEMFKDDPASRDLKVWTSTGPGMCDSCESYCRDSEYHELDFPYETNMSRRDYSTGKWENIPIIKL